jgi:hypothetical protein
MITVPSVAIRLKSPLLKRFAKDLVVAVPLAILIGSAEATPDARRENERKAGSDRRSAMNSS